MREIQIPDDSYKFREDEDEFITIKNLSKVNVLIGANNNGKSRFLRTLFYNNLFFKPDNNDIKTINDVYKYLIENLVIDDFFYKETNFDPSKTLLPIDYLQSNDYINVNGVIKFLKEKVRVYEKIVQEIRDTGVEPHEHSKNKSILNSANSLINQIEEVLNDNDINLIYPFLNIYIPILRGLRPLCYSSDDTLYAEPRDVYAKRTVVDYFRGLNNNFPDMKKNFCVFTGLKTYKYIFDYMHDKSDKKQDVLDEYQNFLSEYFFEGQSVKINPIQVYKDPDEDNQKDLVKIRIGDEEGKLIYELGDGIQSIITITLPLFLYKGIIKENETVQVFIEELELHIHPGLQRKLIETFVNYDGFKKFQFFITTHSSHLLDISFDLNKIAVFSFDKKFDNENNPKFIIENRSVTDGDVLELLGVRSISAFSNCMIFVEGFTDRLYLKKYFDIYQKEKMKDGSMEFLEDYHYSFFDYHGSNISNSFLLKEDKYYSKNTLRLKNSTFVLMDGDKTGTSIANELDTILKDNFKLLSCKEIENLVSKETLLQYLKEDQNYNEDELNDFEESDYQKIDCKLFEFIQNKIVKPSAKKFQENKNNFCYNILNHSNEWDDLSDLTIKLCDDLHAFIKKMNNS